MNRIVRYALFVGALAAASSCGSSNSSTTTPTAPSGGASTAVAIVAGARTLTTNAYAPNPVTITAGTTVTWTNQDTASHTTTSDNSVFGSGTIAPNGQFSFTFANKGTFTYHCAFHPGMVGTVVVQ